MDYELFVDIAISLATFRGFDVKVIGDRLHVSKGSETFSTLIIDGTISRHGFDRFLRELKGA